jgi:hypothetical protein
MRPAQAAAKRSPCGTPASARPADVRTPDGRWPPYLSPSISNTGDRRATYARSRPSRARSNRPIGSSFASSPGISRRATAGTDSSSAPRHDAS